MISKTANEYDHEQTDSYDYDDELTRSENLIASRKCSFEDLDGDYLDALRYVSIRVQCPRCHRKKGQLCVGCMNGEPAHKSRMKLLSFTSKKVTANLRYAMKSKQWKGDNIVVKIDGKWEIVECSDLQWRELWKKQLDNIRI